MELTNFVSRIDAAIKNCGREFEHYEIIKHDDRIRVKAWDGEEPVWSKDGIPEDDGIMVEIERVGEPNHFSNVDIVSTSI